MDHRAERISLFFQDDWKVGQRLTLNLGLRYEYFPLMSRADRGLEQLDYNTFMIRLGGLGGNPYPGFEELRKNMPGTKMGEGGFWAVSRHEDVVRHLHIGAGLGVELADIDHVRPERASADLEIMPRTAQREGGLVRFGGTKIFCDTHLKTSWPLNGATGRSVGTEYQFADNASCPRNGFLHCRIIALNLPQRNTDTCLNVKHAGPGRLGRQYAPAPPPVPEPQAPQRCRARSSAPSRTMATPTFSSPKVSSCGRMFGTRWVNRIRRTFVPVSLDATT